MARHKRHGHADAGRKWKNDFGVHKIGYEYLFLCLIVLQRGREAELHPTALGHESQGAVGAGVVKPRAVEQIGDVERPLSPRGGLRKCDVRQKRTWGDVFVSGGEDGWRQCKAAQLHGKASTRSPFPAETGL